MLFGPVFQAELLTTARRPRYFVIRAVYGMILLFFIFQNGSWVHTYFQATSGEVSIHEAAWLGRSLFRTLFTVQSVAVVLLTPAMVSGVIAEEKQRKTLQYLLCSRLSSVEIVVGKLAARMLHIGVFLAIGLPVTSLLSLFGGVDPAEVVLVFAGSITTAFFLAALSILLSTQTRRPREATSLAYLILVVWLLGPTLLGVALPGSGPTGAWIYSWIKPVLDWIGPTSPLSLLTVAAMASSRYLQPALWMLGLQTAYGALFVVLAVARLRPRYRNEGERAGRVWQRAIRSSRRILPRPECGDDAMMWKERYVSRTGLATKIASAVVGLGTVACVGYIVFIYAKPAFIELASYGYSSPGVEAARGELNMCLRVLCTIVFSVWGIGVAAAASSGLSSEREQDTWISLIGTPLGPWEIIRAKMFGAFWGARSIGLLLMLLWLTGLAAGAIHPIGFLAVMIESAVFLWFATALGTCLSLRSRSSGRALIVTVATLIFLNGVYLMCCLPIGSPSIIITFGVTPMIEAFSLVSYNDVRSLFTRAWRVGRGSPNDAEVVFTCFLGAISYAVAAALLTQHAVARFEHEAGRPRRPGVSFLPTRIGFDEPLDTKQVLTDIDKERDDADLA